MFSNESIVNMMVEMDKIEEAYQNRPETQKRNEEI